MFSIKKNILIYSIIGIFLLLCIFISIKVDNYYILKDNTNVSNPLRESFFVNTPKPTIIPKQLIDMNNKLTNIELILSGLKEPINNNYDNKITYDNKKPYKASVTHYYG